MTAVAKEPQTSTLVRLLHLAAISPHGLFQSNEINPKKQQNHEPNPIPIQSFRLAIAISLTPPRPLDS